MEFILWSFIFLIILAFLFSLFYIIPFLFGAPFEPSHKKQFEKIIEFAEVKKGDIIAELGSGDARIVIALAKKGAIVHGFEINPLLVLCSKARIKKLGLQKNAIIHWKSFWKTKLDNYNTIILFQFHTIMRRLENKIKKESKKGTKIISSIWEFPALKPINKSEDVYLYIV
jgi:hypothetical protein